MAASAAEADDLKMRQDNWASQDDQPMGPGGTTDPVNGASLAADDDRGAGQNPENPDYARGSSQGIANTVEVHRDKQVKPNKVYIGGLPEHTQREDLQNCFGKIGNIVNIELKVGYGFVEFDSNEAAEESVAKYHEGYFMGNKIRVELSRSRSGKFAGEPGACFRCGQMGHWARECPNNPASRRPHYDASPSDRAQRDYPPSSRSYPPPREGYTSPTRYPPPPPRDVRYEYPPAREYRRPPSPREYREYPPPPRGRDYDDYRRAPPSVDRERYPPPPPPSEYRSRYPPSSDPYRSYGSAPPPPAPPPAGYYERFERQAQERYPPSYPPSYSGRPRTPPRMREEYDRAPPRAGDYDYRGRPPSPARYGHDYPSEVGGSDPPPVRYRRRSQSPPRGYEQNYPSSSNYSSHGYNGNSSGTSSTARGNGHRDYAPARNGRGSAEPPSGYRRH